MKSVSHLLLGIVMAATLMTGCTKSKQAKFPETSPAEVTTRFFRLLADGGRLTAKEAQKMVSTKYGVMNEDNFRKQTENFGSAKSKIKVVNTTLPQSASKKGDWIAVVNLEVETPSMFSDTFKSTSQINLILDEKANEWKVDFAGDTIDDAGFKSAPQEAKAPEVTDNGTNTAPK